MDPCFPSATPSDGQFAALERSHARPLNATSKPFFMAFRTTTRVVCRFRIGAYAPLSFAAEPIQQAPRFVREAVVQPLPLRWRPPAAQNLAVVRLRRPAGLRARECVPSGLLASRRRPFPQRLSA